jgi:hypothetical protein
MPTWSAYRLELGYQLYIHNEVGRSFLREVGYRKEGVLVEDIALDEPLQEGP